MRPQRLTGPEIAEVLADVPGELCDRVLELRELILETVPEVAEGVKFHALTYYRPDAPFGSIGGHVVSIGHRDDSVFLGFIHGAFLPDPRGLLEGRAKSKREMPLPAKGKIDREAIRDLLGSAYRHRPG